jgi:hypothetical protein
MPRSRIFLLSPAHCGGKRAGYLLDDRARFPLAQRIRDQGITLGEAFSFLSGLYFRGKLAYATRFARPAGRTDAVQVITANRGLLPVGTVIGVDDLRAFAGVDIHQDDPRYRAPLERDLERLSAGKPEIGERLLFPAEFVGRGDMSRGALLLRASREGRELACIPVAGAVRSTARRRAEATA